MKPHKILITAIAALALTACSPSGQQADDKPKGSTSQAQSGPVSEAIGKLTISEETTEPAYTASKFTFPVTDADGCDTLQRVLIAEAAKKPKVGKPGCELEGGEWISYLDGKTITDPADLTIDHTVPLAEAWRSGASSWDDEKRKEFANDTEYAPTLSAVSVSSSAAKGDKDPAKWMPGNEAATCLYAGSWIATKIHWNLTADQAEVDALRSLKGCQKLVMEWKNARD